MAYRIGLLGPPNSGKTFARTFIEKGEEVFVIEPSLKASCLTTSQGDPVKMMDISIEGKGNTIIEIQRNLGLPNRHEVVSAILAGIGSGQLDKAKVKVTGNFVISPKLQYIPIYQQLIAECRPEIKTIIQADFSHYISHILSLPEFRSRKKGGEAFERFWDLAADSLVSVIESSDHIRHDMLVITEYHAEYDENFDVYKIFVPAGKMLSDKFKPESYYDVMLHTYVVPYDEEQDDSKRFKFVITKKGRFDGRGMNLFNDIAVDGMIPNNLQLVTERVRKSLGI